MKKKELKKKESLGSVKKCLGRSKKYFRIARITTYGRKKIKKRRLLRKRSNKKNWKNRNTWTGTKIEQQKALEKKSRLW